MHLPFRLITVAGFLPIQTQREAITNLSQVLIKKRELKRKKTDYEN